jgi:hypothetical protein
MFEQIQNTLYLESLKNALKILEVAEAAHGVARAQNAISELKEAIAKLEAI